MLPGFAAGTAVGGYGQFEKIIFPLMLVFFLFNWVDRIEMGRRFMISGGTIFYHAVCAWIVGEMVTRGSNGMVAGVLAATMVVLVQTLAGMAPVGGAARRAQTQREVRRSRCEHERRGAFRRVEASLDRAGDAIGVAVDRVGDRLGRVFGKTPAEDDEVGETPAEQPSPLPPPAPVTIQPSFVGRTANAGLSFLAKLLLLAGLAFAIVAHSQFVANGEFRGLRSIVQGVDGQITISGFHQSQRQQEIAASAVFVPILLGSLLLVISRRNDGVPHFLRGFFGCLLAIVTAILAFGPLADETALFMTRDWDALANDRWRELLPAAFCLTMSLLLLFWPRKNPYQGPKPIVI